MLTSVVIAVDWRCCCCCCCTDTVPAAESCSALSFIPINLPPGKVVTQTVLPPCLTNYSVGQDCDGSGVNSDGIYSGPIVNAYIAPAGSTMGVSLCDGGWVGLLLCRPAWAQPLICICTQQCCSKSKPSQPTAQPMTTRTWSRECVCAESTFTVGT